MKIHLIFFTTLAVMSVALQNRYAEAQSPDKISYQAVIRNNSNQLVTSHAIGIRISILQGSTTGTVVFAETQTPTTNSNGLLTVEIGGGTLISGMFANIDWSNGPYFIKTETDPTGGNDYSITGTSQILSVPYAIYAKSAGNGFSGNYNDLTNKPSFSVLTDATLTGDGTNTSPLKIAQQSATAGQVLKWNGTIWSPGEDLTGGGGTLPGGSTGHIQFNNAGVFGGDANFFWDNANKRLGLGTATPGSPLSLITGSSTGIYSESSSSSAIAIKGSATSATGETYGLFGFSNSSSGFGVYGYAGSVTGTTFGVVGSSAATSGMGVFGDATATTGNTFGVIGRNAGVTGVGVYGNNTSTSGTTIGVKGWVASPNGYSGYFTGGRFYVEGTVGIGTDNPSAKLEVAGQIKITGGTPAAGKVLTSDANGLATWQVPSGNSSHYIGESYGGGIVFYVFDNGQHGLIAATADQSTSMRWYAGTNTNTMAFADGVGAGKANTAIIIANQGYGDGATYAARICNEYSVTFGGVTYADWYLPSKFELNLLYLQKSVVGGFSASIYWSSTESNTFGSWGLASIGGNQNNYIKYGTGYVRAIRAF